MSLKKNIGRFLGRNKQPTIDRIDRIDVSPSKGYSSSLKKIMNLLNYTKTSGVSYSAIGFDSGYHTMKIDGHQFNGQRIPEERFKDITIDLNNKSVLDLGCNQGAMLSTFADKIKWGVGLDYDSRMINVANRIRSHKGASHIDYFVFDLENENLDYINDFLPEDKVDVVLLLSVCMWIKNWRALIDFCSVISNSMIFESNGNETQQKEQEEYLRKVYKTVEKIQDRSEDDKSQKFRKLFVCQ